MDDIVTQIDLSALDLSYAYAFASNDECSGNPELKAAARILVGCITRYNKKKRRLLNNSAAEFIRQLHMHKSLCQKQCVAVIERFWMRVAAPRYRYRHIVREIVEDGFTNINDVLRIKHTSPFCLDWVGKDRTKFLIGTWATRLYYHMMETLTWKTVPMPLTSVIDVISQAFVIHSLSSEGHILDGSAIYSVNLRMQTMSLFKLLSDLLLHPSLSAVDGSSLSQQIVLFDEALRAWWVTERTNLMAKLRQGIVACAHGQAMIIGSANEDVELQGVVESLAMLTKIYEYFADDDDDFFAQCNSLKALKSVVGNPFWGPLMTQAEVLHEVLIDPEEFKMTPDQCFPDLDATPTIQNLVAVALWPCRNPVHIELVSSSLSYPDSLLETIRMLSGNQALRTNIEAVRFFRVKLANESIATCKLQLSRLMLSHTVAVSDMCKPLRVQDISITRKWLEWTMQSFSMSDLNAVKSGHPHIMLHAHDIGIMNLVLSTEQPIIPEILQHDSLRLKCIHAELTGKNITPAQLCEGVMAKNWRKCSYSPDPWASLLLHRIVFVSRIVHGDLVSRIAHKLAQGMVSRYC